MNVKRVAESTASGHAYERHIRQKKEFPGIESRDDFARLIERIIRNPSASKKLLRARQAFWEEATQAIVIVDPGNPDFGTAFVPEDGEAYFRDLIEEDT